MANIFLIILLGLVATASEILGGWLVVKNRKWFQLSHEYLLALGAGFLLALVITELIPISFQEIKSVDAALWILIGFSTMHFVEHTLVGHFHFGEETHHEKLAVSKIVGLSTSTGLFMHAFFDGFIISSALQFNLSIGLTVFLGIILHKFPEGLTVATIMRKVSDSDNLIMKTVVFVSSGTMLGILVVFLISSLDLTYIGYIFAFSAGTALYVGGSDLIPEINKSENRIMPVIVFVGMLFFYISKVLIEIGLQN
ncbi:MAG: hypothetical protein EXR24_03945 [Ignavibacteria bacterium]|nr:hypothetical protein [Ignavibacteria bacterium]